MLTAEEFIQKKKSEYQKNKDKFDVLLKEGREVPNSLLIGMKDIGRETRIFFTREAWTFLVQSNLDKKVFVVERLKKHSVETSKMAYPDSWVEGDTEYRIGYYIVGRIGKAKNKWIWGQFCPLIPKHDLDLLFKKAKEEGTIV